LDFTRWVRSTGLANYSAKVVIAAAMDEQGKPLFARDDLEALGDRYGAVVSRIANIVLALHGGGLSDIDELGADPASGLDSPPKPVAYPIGAADQSLVYTKPFAPKYWRDVFNVSQSTFLRRVSEGKIRSKKLTSKQYRIAIDDLPPAERKKHLGIQSG
jgi:hypothetical protein